MKKLTEEQQHDLFVLNKRKELMAELIETFTDQDHPLFVEVLVTQARITKMEIELIIT